MLPLSSALGVTPSRVPIPANPPNTTYEVGVCFEPDQISRVKIEKWGEFENYIKIVKGPDAEGYMELFEDPCLTYQFTTPLEIEKPGIHMSGISAVEDPEYKPEGSIFAFVRIIHQIMIDVPYPGKYLEIESFKPENSAAGAVVPINILLRNKGVENISEANGRIIIYDKDNNRIGGTSIKTLKNIEPQQTRQLTVSWDSGEYLQGNYRAEFLLDYDGLFNNESSAFKLGGLDVSMVDYTNQVYYGGLKEFYVTVDSIWSEPIDGVRANVNVLNGTTSITRFETLTRKIAAWGTENLQAYIDTQATGLGEFELEINLSFADQSKIYQGKISVIELPKPEEEKKAFEFTATTVLLITISILFLIIILILLLTLFRKKNE